MSEVVSEPRKDEQAERQKPGYGVDRTLIHRMLALTPEERLKALVRESNKLTALFRNVRFK